MADPKDLIADVKLDFSVALDSMMKQAREMPCESEQDAEAIKNFMSLIKDFFAEQKALLMMIQEAGKMLQVKLAKYNAKTKQQSIDDL